MSTNKFTEEEVKRFKEYYGEEPTPDMKVIPQDVIGIAYKFSPISFHFEDQKTMDDFLKKVDITFGHEPKIIGEKEIKIIVFNTAVSLGCAPHGRHLGLNTLFFDPKETEDLIKEIENRPHTTLLGFINAVQFCKLMYAKTVVLLYQTGSFVGELGPFHITMIKNDKYGKEARIFNWRMEVYVRSLEE